MAPLNLNLISINFEIDGQSSSVTLSKDGAQFSKEGKTTITKNPTLFNELIPFVGQKILDAGNNGMKVMKSPEIKGKVCHLVMNFKSDTEAKSGMDITFGTESKQPPKEIMDLLAAALKIIDLSE